MIKRHLIRVKRRHNMTNKNINNDKGKYNDNDTDKDNNNEWWGDMTWPKLTMTISMRPWQFPCHLGNTQKEQSLRHDNDNDKKMTWPKKIFTMTKTNAYNDNDADKDNNTESDEMMTWPKLTITISKTFREHPQRATLEPCDLILDTLDTDYISNNWEQQFHWIKRGDFMYQILEIN